MLFLLKIPAREGIAAKTPEIPCSGRYRDGTNRVGGAEINGGRGRNRTNDTRIFSPLLYQLSYPAICNKTVVAYDHPWWAAQLGIHASRSRLLRPPLAQLSSPALGKDRGL